MTEQTEQLMRWYDRNRRILPWREDPTPYHIWLSEIILQQTRVEAGIACYERFLEALPDIRSLADAGDNQLLKLWEGLGYYSRVRNLHRAAEIVVSEYGGELPGTAEELEKLPGIGPYTAAAIASIAFGQPVVSVDGNLVRVFARVMEYGGDSRTGSARKAAENYYAGMQPAERPGDFNQALMDLGAMVCLPNGEPRCAECPWQEVCAAHGDERETEYPVMPEKKKRRLEKRTVLLIRSGKHVLIRRRADKGLLAGLYEFPNTEGWLNEKEAADYVRGLLRSGAGDDSCGEGAPSEDGGETEMEVRPLGEAKHIFSHIEWHMAGYCVRLPEGWVFPEGEDKEAGRKRRLPVGLIAATREELNGEYAIPSAFETYRRMV